MKVGAKLLYGNILFRQKRPHRPRPQLFKLFDQKFFFREFIGFEEGAL